MRRASLLMMVLLVVGCEDERAGPSSAEVDALLQRLDTMSRRLDAIEDAIEHTEPAPNAERPPSMPMGDPTVTADPTEAKPESLRVDIEPGSLTIDGVALSREQAADRFREVARKSPGTRLVLLASPDVPHAEMVEVLDLAQEAGLTEVAMSARMHGEAEPATAAR